MDKLLFVTGLFILSAFPLSAQTTSIYSIGSVELDRTTEIKMSNYSGRLIMLVNIASMSKAIDQMAELEQLYQLYKDSGMVIIGVPSNSFGNEPGSETEIRRFLENRFHPSFPLTRKEPVVGESIDNLFGWLTDIQKNGLLNRKVKEDFTKYLISREGKIIGIFSQSVNPMNSVVIDAIKKNLH